MNTVEIKSENKGPTHLPSQFSGSRSSLFLTPELNQRLDLLRHLVINSSRIPLVKGPLGLGKTTLLNRLREMSPADWLVCQFSAAPGLQPEQLYQALSDRFGVPVDAGRSNALFLRRFEELRREGYLPVLLLDDAHLLPLSSLKFLVGLHQTSDSGEAQLKMVLFALPELEAELRNHRFPFVEQQTIQTLELFPFDRDRTEQMAYHLLRAAGVADTANVTIGRLNRIFLDSNGIPGEIEKQVQTLLQETGSAQRKPVTKIDWASMLKGRSVSTWSAGSIVALLLVLVLFFQDDINLMFSAPQADAEVPPPGSFAVAPIVPLPLPDPGISPIAQSSSEQPSSLEQVRRAAAAEIGMTQALPMSHGVAESASGKPVLPKDSDDLVLPVAESEAETIKLGDEVSMVVAVQEPVSSNSAMSQSRPIPEAFPAAVGPGNLPAGSTAKETNSRDPRNPEPVSAETRSLTTDAAPTSKKKKVAVRKIPSAKPVQVGRAEMKGESWLMQQTAQAYTLQLVGLGEETAASKFIRQHRLTGKIAYFRTTRNGAPWFSVVLGVYPSRAAAATARDRLPSGLRNSGAWPRTFGSIQEAIQSR